MTEFELEKIFEWLDVTNQQFEFLKVISFLESKKKKTNPKAMIETYHEFSGKNIETSNLFHVLRHLRNNNYIKKNNSSEYFLNIEGIRGKIIERKKETEKELSNFDNALNNIERYTRNVLYPQTPSVEYLTHDELYANITQRLKTAKFYGSVAKFPNPSWTPEVAFQTRRTEYIETIQKRCFTGDMKLLYLTDLDVDYLIRAVQKYHKDPEKIKDISMGIVDNLKYQVDTYDKLDVRCIGKKMGPLHFDIMIPKIGDEPTEFYFYIRAELDEIVGGIHISSPIISKHVEDMYLRECDKAKKLDGPDGEKIIKDTKKRLTASLKKIA